MLSSTFLRHLWRLMHSWITESWMFTMHTRGELSLPRRLGGRGISSQVLFFLLLFRTVATGIAVVLRGRGSRLAQCPPLFIEGREESDEVSHLCTCMRIIQIRRQVCGLYGLSTGVIVVASFLGPSVYFLPAIATQMFGGTNHICRKKICGTTGKLTQSV